MKSQNKLYNLRTFFAIELPDGVRGWINGNVIIPLSKLPCKVTWVAPKNIHLTMRFLGEITFDEVAKVIQGASQSIKGISPIPLNLLEIGTFGGHSPRVVWIGIGGEKDKLAALYDKIENSCRASGLSPDDKKFSPHITIGRVKSPAHTAQLISAIKKIEIKPLDFIANEIILFKSTLTPSGAIYDVVERFAL